MKRLAWILVLLIALPSFAQDQTAAKKKKPKQEAKVEIVARATNLIYPSRYGDCGLFLVRLNKKEKSYKRYLILLKDPELRQDFLWSMFWSEIFEIRGKLIGIRKGTDVINPTEIIQLTKRNETILREVIHDGSRSGQ